MISMLKGLVDHIAEDHVVLDVNGVGYHAFCSRRTLSRLPRAGEAVRIEIETHVREDHIHLYGFYDETERDWFRLLTTVQGVGARVCLAILSVLGPDELIQAIAAQDKAAVSRANG
ncbi:MAG: Holliday junction branch migration protein RuvA, partial [Alphaproteobacteria bacterium]|nr:Holliday junction branch migration protein RuvA [Alphaproteobacteria bacterium]